MGLLEREEERSISELSIVEGQVQDLHMLSTCHWLSLESLPGAETSKINKRGDVFVTLTMSVSEMARFPIPYGPIK